MENENNTYPEDREVKVSPDQISMFGEPEMGIPRIIDQKFKEIYDSGVIVGKRKAVKDMAERIDKAITQAHPQAYSPESLKSLTPMINQYKVEHGL